MRVLVVSKSHTHTHTHIYKVEQSCELAPVPTPQCYSY